MAKVVVQEHIDNIVKYLQPRLPLANFHMVDYFSTDVFKLFFSDVRNEIVEISPQATIEAIFNNDLTKLPQLKTRIEELQQFQIKHSSNVCLSFAAFENKLSEWNSEDIQRLKLNKFMNSKKSHEVDILSYICAALRNTSKTSHLIDIGDGKGYLSSMLALQHKIPVLGIDCSQINTDGAVKRVQKLSKVWNGITDNKGKGKDTSAHLYKQITLFVDETVDFPELISRIFLEKSGKIGIVGLHTCGNLASNSLKTYVNNPDIKTICNVGCCYHLLDEPNYFPMSQYLREKNFTLGRSARMIATQSYERMQNNRELPNKKIFYRALFEVLLNQEHCGLSKNDRQVGRFKKKVSGFVEYVRNASTRINLKIEKSDAELEKFYDEFKPKECELYLFYLLRSKLSPTIESLILLDRLLFLLENNLKNSYLVQLFDPIISPRCYAVISIK